ncbi:MAG: hypothetical protein ACO34E_00220 [Limisphaerales bacterium]|jgi:Tfp pilus assembly protein PilO
MKLSKDKRNQLVLTVILTLAAGAVIWQLLIQSTRNAIDRHGVLSKEAKEKLANAQSYVSKVAALQSEANQLSNSLARLEATMADHQDPFLWARDLINDAKEPFPELQLSVDAPSAQDVEMIGDFPYKALAFKVSGEGYFEQFGAFIATFENAYPMFRTQNLEVAPIPVPLSSVDSSASGSKKAATLESDPSREKLSFKFDVVALTQPSAKVP